MNQSLWRPEDLGRPIPAWPNATSVCLPTWRDNVGYEEGEPRVLESMRCGYPRFVIHEYVEQANVAAARVLGADQAFLLTSQSAATRCSQYLATRGHQAHQEPYGNAWAVGFARSAHPAAKQYWQHCGEGISWRQARAIDQPMASEDGPLRDLLASFAEVPADDVFLFSSGMSSVFAAWRIVTAMSDAPTTQFGFPYLDSLKIQQRFGRAVRFIADCEQDPVATLEAGGRTSAVFCELPTNPLLQSPDLPRLSQWCRANGVPLVVDDTVATFANVDLRPFADVIVSSLTKFLSGKGDVIAGSLILNRESPLYAPMRDLLLQEYEATLWPEDAACLAINARTFPVRMNTINANGAAVAAFLAGHSRIARVYYPSLTGRTSFDAVRRPDGGYGGLLAFDLIDPAKAPAVFDALEVAKGPSLGMECTLASPYTILAHYDELEFAESCGLSRYLIRVSCGTEADLIERFEKALAFA